jgi:hypothetical protein
MHKSEVICKLIDGKGYIDRDRGNREASGIIPASTEDQRVLKGTSGGGI